MVLKVVCLATGGLLLFASFILYVRFTRDNARGERSLSWPTTAGRITQSRIDVIQHRSTATEYVDRIVYEFTVRDRVYRYGQVDLKVRDVSDRAAMRAFVNSYHVGQEVLVHYDPENPEYALLVPGPALETSGPRILIAKILFPLGLGLITLPFLRRL